MINEIKNGKDNNKSIRFILYNILTVDLVGGNDEILFNGEINSFYVNICFMSLNYFHTIRDEYLFG